MYDPDAEQRRAAPRRAPSHHAAPNALCGGFHSSCQTVIHLSPLPSLPPSTLALSSHPTPPSLLPLLLRLIVSITRVCLREHPALFRPMKSKIMHITYSEGWKTVVEGGLRRTCIIGRYSGGKRRRPRGMNHVATRRDCRDFRDQRAERCLSHLSSVGCRSDSKKQRLFPSVAGAHKKEGVTAKSKGGGLGGGGRSAK